MMRVFLIRHGETVDNVANLYAGSRDSELTNHGVQQATRLGQHFAASAVQFTHIFSSQLKRAVKTAELVRRAQPVVEDGEGKTFAPLVAQISELAEQDFGSYEGVSFMTRYPGSKVSGKDAHHAVHKDDPDFVDVESKDSMLRRVDVFLDGHLMPIIQAVASTALCVAVVSHGITLSVLWRRLLQRLPPKSVTVHPEVLTKYSGIDLERIGGWSNTGYLELDITHTAVAKVASSKASSPTSLLGTPPPEVEQDISVTPTSALPSVAASTGSHFKGHADKISVPVSTSATPLLVFVGWTVTVCAVNSRQHLVDLKRTGGGVGSAHHDDKQKSIDTFFKRKKVE